MQEVFEILEELARIKKPSKRFIPNEMDIIEEGDIEEIPLCIHEPIEKPYLGGGTIFIECKKCGKVVDIIW